ncbi:MAG: hypothetical protein R2939_12360 [Kofleriaceae bacterium]
MADSPPAARRRAVVGAALAIGLVACATPAARDRAPRLTPTTAPWALDGLRGEWRWLLAREAEGVRTVEDERWEFVDDRASSAAQAQALLGRYVRDVEFTSLDGSPFACNQAPRYRQRAVFELVATVEAGAVTIRETDARAEPSPCEHGLRTLTSYRAELGRATVGLTSPRGAQTLLRTGPGPATLAPVVWPGDAPVMSGAWTFAATTLGDADLVRDEVEHWQLTVDGDDHLAGTVEREIRYRTADGSAPACGGPTSWRLRERVRLEGQRDDDRYVLREAEVLARAVEPAAPGCPPGAARVLDSALVELAGDALVLEWRGKRRQVLLRP